MSQLTINSAAQPEKPLLHTSDFSTIRRQLSAVGMRFERWQSRIRNHYRDRQRSHLAAYQAEIDKLVTAESYQTWDAFNGLLTPLVVKLFERDIVDGFNACAHALKEYCENRS